MLLLVSLSRVTFALPVCDESPKVISDYSEVRMWTDCAGEIRFGKSSGVLEGNTYSGGWKDGKMHGQGTYTFPDGGGYVGGWKDGKTYGQGTTTYSDGAKYVGEHKSNFHGQGTYTFPNGTKYVGEWKDGKRHGQGAQTDPDGTKYVGGWKDGKTHGQGTFAYSDGTKYVGEFKDGNFFKGQGTEIYPGGKYVGEYKDGKRNGQGTETFRDGKYVGEFKDDKINGQGTYTFADGRKYSGKFRVDENNKIVFPKIVTVQAGNQTTNKPNEQEFMSTLIELAKLESADYSSARKKFTWINANKELCSSKAFNAYALKANWVGIVKRISMDDSGDTTLKISIDNFENTVIQYILPNELIETALEYRSGDKIVFSGYFKKGKLSENECLSAGLDSNPELLDEDFDFIFTAIGN